jgi:hypothetical protein
MASQEELNNQKQFREELEDILFLQRSFTDEALKSAKAVLGTSENAKKTSSAFRGISNLTEDIAAGLRSFMQGEKSLTDILKLQIKQKEKVNKLQIEADNAIVTILGKNSELTENILSQTEIQNKGKAILDAINQTREVLTKDEEYLLSLYADQLTTLGEQEEKMSQMEEARKATGIIGDIGSGVEGLMKKLGAGDLAEKLGFKKAQIAAEDYALKAGKGANKFQAAGVYIKTLGSNLLKALGPLTLIAQFVQGLLQADKETTELQKSMALTKTEAVGFRMELMNAAGATGDINITSSKLLETFGALNKQFGFITNFATDTLVTMTKLTGVVGVSSESAGNLAAASELTGTSFESNYKDVLGTSYELQRQSGVQMDLRDILEQTGKVTGTVRANLGANPAQIAKAITQAKLFGASLQDVANAGKSLLDFESSITAELEAELLLGKDINLERARAAALAGDQVTLAQELQKEAGNFSDFTKMNVIQQEALAKAMGMTSDQLADILFQQEVQGKSAKELRALGKEDLAQRVEAQTLQDRLSATMEKMQNLFVDLASGITPILFVLGKALSIVGVIAGMIQDIISGIGMLFGMDMPESSATAGAFKSLFGMETADDAVIPAGYGDTIIKKGKDTIALNNNDTVVAGTNLMSQTQPTSPSVDNTETKRTNQLLERLLNQPAVFKIGTDEFYTATSKYSYQVQ